MHGENDCGGYAKACHAAHAKVRGGRRVSCTVRDRTSMAAGPKARDWGWRS